MTVRNKEEFNSVWEVITERIFTLDRNRNIYEVNQWSYYTVKYYTDAVLKYGNVIQKKALRNFVRLLDNNGFIDEEINEHIEENEESNNTISNNTIKEIIICLILLLLILGIVPYLITYLM